MATERANDPRAFRDFLDANLGGGDENLTLYDYLDLWDFENSPNEAKEETVRRFSRDLRTRTPGGPSRSTSLTANSGENMAFHRGHELSHSHDCPSRGRYRANLHLACHAKPTGGGSMVRIVTATNSSV